MADHPGLQPLNLFILFFPYACAITIVAIRIWKRTAERKFSLDDGLITVAMILDTGLTVATFILIKKSYIGYRLENIPHGRINKITTAKWRYVTSVTYNPTLNLIKISFLVTLIKLKSPNKWIVRCLWGFLVITIMFAISITLTSIISCVPLARFWDRRVKGHCRNSEQFIMASNSTTIITDLLVTIMPGWILWKLQMPRKNKIIIWCFMSLGLVVTGITAYRLVYFINLFKIKDPVRNENPHNVRTPLSNLEVNLSAIAACGPTIKWLLAQCIPFFDSSRKPASSYHYTRNKTLGYRKERSKGSSKTGKNDTDLDLELTMFEEPENNESTVKMRDQSGWNGMNFELEHGGQGEQNQMKEDGGIVKTVEWKVSDVGKDPRTTPTQPRDII